MNLFGAPRRKKSRKAQIKKLQNKIRRKQEAAREKKQLETLKRQAANLR